MSQELDNLRIQNPRIAKDLYDPACYDLACKFTPEEDLREELAKAIQGTIEGIIELANDREAGFDPRNDPLDHDYSMNG